MIGIIPSQNKTFEIHGDFSSKNPIEGKLYYDPSDKRLYYYSLIETRSNPRTGYFPVWNGKEKFSSNFSNQKFFDKDAIKSDIESMCSRINSDVAEQIRYNQRKSANGDVLRVELMDGDNMFTQCIKGIINSQEWTMIDLVDMTEHKMDEKTVENYFNALSKITFMRIDKWDIWINVILHIHYILDVYKGDKQLLSYSYPEDVFDTGIVKYDNIINSDCDPFKRIIKIIILMENINKNSLKSDEVDDYTINNMMTTLNGKKALSAQLFSRFMHMANLSYCIRLYNQEGTMLFEYKE